MAGYGLTSKGINYNIMRDKGPHGHASQPHLSVHNKGGRVGLNKGGRTGRQIGGRANLLEEVGRLDAERMNPNRRAEKHRVIGELNRGYNKGGRVGADKGTYITKKTKYITKKEKPKSWITKKDRSTQGKDVPTMASKGEKVQSKPKTKIITGEIGKGDKVWTGKSKAKWTGRYHKDGTKSYGIDPVPSTKGVRPGKKFAAGGRVGLKKGGDDKWIQKVDASIKRRGTKGKCTPITKPGCTGKAKALAKTFKKMAAKRKKS